MSPSRTSSRRARCGMTQSAAPAPDEDVAAEHGQRRRARLERGGRVARAPKRGRLLGQAKHLERIDGARVDLQRVTARSIPVTNAASPNARRNRDTFVCSVLRAVDSGLVSPQVLDQPLGADHDAGLEGQTDEHLGGLAPAHRYALAVAVQLDHIEHRHRDHHRRVRPIPRVRPVSGLASMLHTCPPNPTT